MINENENEKRRRIVKTNDVGLTFCSPSVKSRISHKQTYLGLGLLVIAVLFELAEATSFLEILPNMIYQLLLIFAAALLLWMALYHLCFLIYRKKRAKNSEASYVRNEGNDSEIN
ncbi:CLUMA_CG008598, isoform A [Clunio marinus]|uniref:CLUMA_CG008598, isoform A n=1 Tax=Clunio marinus TaxID=568069 RepID=A0A1J1I489_9DIPT|nr:CLUMA_CG008598, isoform A [Clunio marinus]